MGSVKVGAQAPIDEDSSATPPTTDWKVRGTLKLQRIENDTIAAALTVEKIILDKSGDVFYQNKEMQNIYLPFKISLNENVITNIGFKEKDSIWSKNIKRAIASAIQLQGEKMGAYIVSESGIHGICTTEYYVTRINSTNISIRKTPELNSCKPFTAGIHTSKSNVPTNPCDYDHQKNVIVGTETFYEILQNNNNEYYLNSAHVEGVAMVHTFESNGEAQYVSSELTLQHIHNSDIVNVIDIVSEMSPQTETNLEFEEPIESTGGRQPLTPENLIKMAQTLLFALTDKLEDSHLNFEKPFDSRIVELIKIMSSMNFESLSVLYRVIDIGTSYRQETVRNIFFEILPRIGTKASALLTRDLIINNSVRPTTAVQLLMALQFHIDEFSTELITELEALLSLGQDRPDVTQAAVLSYATLISHTYSAAKLSKANFEKYVKKYFDMFMSAFDYEQKMLYLLALGNLQLANVVDYLEPIIKDSTQDRDIRFLAAWAVMERPLTKTEKIYETYWPIFEDRNTTLELRIIAFTMLLITNPTPARLMSLHKIMLKETNPHMINYYRTTVMSISGTTYPCYEHLRRLVSYMQRHIPPSPGTRFWVSGNYVFDYRDKNYGVGAMLQSQFIADEKTNLPYILTFKLDTEALGRFSGQLALLIKIRGLNNAIISRLMKINQSYLKLNKLTDILKSLNVPMQSLTQFHLEVILQIEGKSVLSFFLNQKTYLNLSDGDIITRINQVLLSDSHINMQLIRSPFMIKYSTPTVIGTPSEIIIQSTVLSSLRGKITRNAELLTRSNQIDARYTSYSVCKSESYNPFLNTYHTIHREQGFLIYIPINNEFTISVFDRSLKFVFHRPANLTSGFSFKSRSLTTTKGHILRTDVLPYDNVLQPKSDDMVLKLNDYKIPSLGLNVRFSFNLHNIGDVIQTLFTDAIVNAKSFPDQYFLFNIIFTIWEAIQLNSIYIGNNREVSVLLTNVQNSKIQGTISSKENAYPYSEKARDDKEMTIILNLSLEHQSDTEVLQTWEHTVKFTSFHDTDKVKITALSKGQSVDKKKFKMCFDGIYQPFVFLKNSEKFDASIAFGVDSDEIFCPTDRSRFNVTVVKGLADDAKSLYYDGKRNDLETICPREILKLNPPPIVPECAEVNFNKYTSLTNVDVQLKYSNMPKSFLKIMKRFQHFISIFSESNDFDFQNGIDVGFRTPTDDLVLMVNKEQFHIPKVFLSTIENSKFNKKLKIDYGLERQCSIIQNKLFTFTDVLIDLQSIDQNYIFKSNCLTLLVGDCSNPSTFALFLDKSDAKTFGLKMYTAENFVTIKPNDRIINVNGLENITLNSHSYHYPPLDINYDFKVYINEEDILILETNVFQVKIQFDMKNIMNIQLYSIYMERVCGLCSGNIISTNITSLQRRNLCLQFLT